jgi:hypothetical protein
MGGVARNSECREGALHHDHSRAMDPARNVSPSDLSAEGRQLLMAGSVLLENTVLVNFAVGGIVKTLEEKEDTNHAVRYFSVGSRQCEP